MFSIFSLKNGISNVDGFFCDGVNVGMKRDDFDVGFIRSDVLCDISATFTTNRFQASPIKHYKRYPKNFKTNFLLVNSKNANAMTGEEGIRDIETIFNRLQKYIRVSNPIMSSTGVIGYRLDVDRISLAFDKFDFNAKASNRVARAIMTTDKFEKELSFRVVLEDGSSFNIGGVAKGAGMINPAMATMLCFVTTDAKIPKEDMDELLKEAVDNSFNRISVDGDTSTNDTVFLMANGKSGVYNKEAFREALNRMLFEFAMMILRDGEGANKVVAFSIKGAKNSAEAKIASRALSNSLLVKTALFGEDPNWGRIASTIGACGVECMEDTLKIYYDDLLIYSSSKRELDKETEKRAYEIMKQSSFKILCDLGVGEGEFTSYGCDLSYEYIRINAEYRT